MDVRWLEDYLALVELRNFTRAAEFRNVSQAAFSRRIQSLEQWLGTALVVKGATPVRLTEAGEQFREDARVAVERLYESRASIRASQFEVMSQIRIAMPNVLARSEFRQILGLIGDRVDSSFSVIAGTTNDVVARYLAGDADILFSHDCPAIPTHDSLGMHDRLVVRRRPVCALRHTQPQPACGVWLSGHAAPALSHGFLFPPRLFRAAVRTCDGSRGQGAALPAGRAMRHVPMC